MLAEIAEQEAMGLAPVLERVRCHAGDADGRVLELESVITALGYRPLRNETDPARIRERRREKEVTKRRLATLSGESSAVASEIAAELDVLNGCAGDPASFDNLERLLGEQAYRLSFWRVPSQRCSGFCR
jgi:(1->4)-alpha-D-glucan 1-alpha-D-glucosylmutase